jgi:hypothetical protein
MIKDNTDLQPCPTKLVEIEKNIHVDKGVE